MTKAKAKAAAAEGDGMTPRLMLIPLDKIVEPELPARESMDERAMAELVDSMREIGLLSPILVFERGGVYEVDAGHRRLLAARQLKWTSIPALVHDSDWDAKEAAMLHENVVREQLNAGEEAIFIAQLIEKYQLDEEGVCAMTRRSPDYIADRMRLIRGDEQVLMSLRRGEISFAVARELNKFTDETMRRYYLDAAIRAGCSSRVVTTWLNEWRSQQSMPAVVASETQAVVEQELPPVHVDACFFCGGAKDPYNLVTVRIHRWELEELQKRLAAAGVAE